MLKTKTLTLTALFAALIAIFAQISIPIGVVPVNFAHIGIFLGAALLGPKFGALSTIIYVLMGMVGVPVFSGFNGGFGSIVGPTGGFILGYILCSFLTGHLVKATHTYIIPMIVGLLANYLVGIPWLMFVTGMNFASALMVAVIPFLLGDGFKIILSAIIAKRLNSFN